MVLCTAYASTELLAGAAPSHGAAPATGPGAERLRAALDQVAGQVAIGPWTAELAQAAPHQPVSGNGHFIPAVPTDHGHAEPTPAPDTSLSHFGLSGSTYERMPLTDLNAHDGLQANQARLQVLIPQAHAALQAQFETAGNRQQHSADCETDPTTNATTTPAASTNSPSSPTAGVRTWAGQRCTSRDRLPITGLWSSEFPGLHLSAAMGSRGLTFAALCAELLAAQLHGEPLPLEASLAKAFAADRFGRAQAQTL
jgi:tRNA 5-methylaminomethyl-2-thiouridine biosynthesis bifunctional protein